MVHEFNSYVDDFEGTFVSRDLNAEEILQLAHCDVCGCAGCESIDQRIAEQRGEASQPKQRHEDLVDAAHERRRRNHLHRREMVHAVGRHRGRDISEILR